VRRDNSKASEYTIKMVENSLGGPVQVEGVENAWNIQVRMKEKGISGVSVAVSRDYKLNHLQSTF
jgi:hypothetical protein